MYNVVLWCIHVCMYVCMYSDIVCVCVCVIHIHVHVYGCLNVCMCDVCV